MPCELAMHLLKIEMIFTIIPVRPQEVDVEEFIGNLKTSLLRVASI